MVYTPLPLVEKCCLVQLQEVSPRLLAGQLSHSQMVAVCTLYRRIGIARLFLTGLPEGLFESLSLSAQAFLAFLQAKGDVDKVTSLCEPLFDAVACGDRQAEQGIAHHSRTTWHESVEYEEDFLYARFLMDRFVLSVPTSHCEAMLERYATLRGDSSDARLEVCRALLERDATLFEEGLERLLDKRLRLLRKQLRTEQLHPDDVTTTAHLSVEVLALLQFAERAGLTPGEYYPLAPSLARRLHRARRPPAEAWRHLLLELPGSARSQP